MSGDAIIERRECGRCGAEVREGKRIHYCGEPYPLKTTDDIRVVRYVPEAEAERLKGVIERDQAGHERIVTSMGEEIKQLREGIDAVRALAACYDEELLRSDHVVDDLFGDGGRGWLRVAGDHIGEYQTVLTAEGRRAIVRLLNDNQAAAEAASEEG